ncbi:hypothetical protein [Pararhizobium qamdonense]|uniref:hypothetical protein n=1 Tax=Pararhizobium qamdonense TaxID=3031126 RepID=UPI0023E150D0|nr:hypothetical protein [Pararhizobium qamdonense]
MSHYRKIDVHVWNDARFMSLTLHGQLAWFMLLTHPMMTSLGAIRATPDGLAAELSRGDEGYREAFREALQDVIDKGMADYDPKANLLALPNFLKYNKPESPNVVKAWAKSAGMLPECELKSLIIQRSIAYAEGMGKAFKSAVHEAFPKASPKAYPKSSPIQRAEKQRAESRDEDSAYDEERDSTEGTYTRETMFTPFPIPSSAAEGRTFLLSKGVPQELLDSCLPILLGGNLSPYDLEGILSEARSAA